MDPGHQAESKPSPRTPALSRPQEVTEDIESCYQLAMEGQIADAQHQLSEVSEWATTLRDEVEYLKAEVARIESSRSWRLTEPFRRAAQAWQSRSTILTWPTVMRVRSALRTLPLPRRPVAALKRVALKHIFGIAPRRATQGAIASTGRRRAGSPRVVSRTLPVLAAAELPDVYVWASTDWHFRIQRPQHLARELAGAGHRVFYVSPPFVDRAGPGFEVEPVDDTGRLFVVRLHAQAVPPIHAGAAGKPVRAQILGGLGRIVEWTGGSRTVNLVQHPFWLPFAEAMPNNVLVYDYMDHRAGLGSNSPDVVALETRLLRRADLVVVASSWLERIARQSNPRVVLVRDAGDYEHFSKVTGEIHADSNGRRIIGYYGAIAEGFDVDLVRAVATSFPGVLVLLIGEDTVGARRQLAQIDNITFTGEVSYAALPGFLHAFDVCILPLRIVTSTLAANPVAVYEYLSAGKPVVVVDLPEMRQFGELARRAGSAESFVLAVGEALLEPPGSQLVEARKRFASEHSWTARADVLRQQIDAIQSPLVSVIVVTYNNLELTKQCLASVEAMTSYTNYEVILVDNGSNDGTHAFLEQWSYGRADRHVVLNPDNRGFAAASNQGLAHAGGDYLVLLNNDTVVTAGWLGTLIGHLRRDPRIGLISAVTNDIDNEARIAITYADLGGMHAEARLWTCGHLGQTRSMPSAAFFCVAMSREVYREVGPLDEAFGLGMFEDDDYCRRVEQTGRDIVCALDVFIHHQSAASFDAMDQTHRWELFERNKKMYEAKWGPWPRRFHSEKAQTRFRPRV